MPRGRLPPLSHDLAAQARMEAPPAAIMWGGRPFERGRRQGLSWVVSSRTQMDASTTLGTLAASRARVQGAVDAITLRRSGACALSCLARDGARPLLLRTFKHQWIIRMKPMVQYPPGPGSAVRY